MYPTPSEEMSNIAGMITHQSYSHAYRVYIHTTYTHMTYIHTYIHTYTHIHTHIHTYTHIHAYIHTHIHTYTHTYSHNIIIIHTCLLYVSILSYLV